MWEGNIHTRPRYRKWHKATSLLASCTQTGCTLHYFCHIHIFRDKISTVKRYTVNSIRGGFPPWKWLRVFDQNILFKKLKPDPLIHENALPELQASVYSSTWHNCVIEHIRNTGRSWSMVWWHKLSTTKQTVVTDTSSSVLSGHVQELNIVRFLPARFLVK
jgi:hypothetical protein